MKNPLFCNRCKFQLDNRNGHRWIFILDIVIYYYCVYSTTVWPFLEKYWYELIVILSRRGLKDKIPGILLSVDACVQIPLAGTIFCNEIRI